MTKNIRFISKFILVLYITKNVQISCCILVALLLLLNFKISKKNRVFQIDILYDV